MTESLEICSTTVTGKAQFSMADAYLSIPTFSKALFHRPRFWTPEKASDAPYSRCTLPHRNIQRPLAKESNRIHFHHDLVCLNTPTSLHPGISKLLSSRAVTG